jgi:hypothetical protein
MSLVWEDILDKAYKVQVERLKDPDRDGVWPHDLSRKGMLHVIRLSDGAVLHSTPVFITCGAPMGPDVGDVQEWQDMAVKFVDGMKPPVVVHEE